MAIGSSTRPMARTPKVSARTPIIAQAKQRSGAVSKPTSAGAMTMQNGSPGATSGPTAGASQGATAPGSPAPMMVSNGYAQSAGNADALASQSAATGAGAQPPAEDLLDAELTTSLRNDILDVITTCVNHWRLQAHFRNISINGPVAVGAPGCLTGPDLRSLRVVSGKYHGTDGVAREVMDMAVRAVSDAFEAWQHFVTMPGLPIFPAFAAYPGPAAPPMPSMPVILATCPSTQASHLTNPTTLKNAILDEAPQGVASPGLVAFCGNLAQCCTLGFQTFLASQVATNIMGYGRVPSFAPPIVPIGPVINGEIIAAPGHFANSSTFSIPRLPLA